MILFRLKSLVSTLARGLVLVLVCSLAITTPAHPFASKLSQPDGHVSDFAEVIDPATRQRLEGILGNLEQQTGITFVIATVATSGDQDLYDYSLRVAEDWDIGSPTTPRKSLLLLIATDNKRFFTHYSRSVQADLPNGLVGSMGRLMRPQFQTGHYREGLLTGVETFVSILGIRKNFTFQAMDRPLQSTRANSSETANGRTVGSSLQPVWSEVTRSGSAALAKGPVSENTKALVGNSGSVGSAVPGSPVKRAPAMKKADLPVTDGISAPVTEVAPNASEGKPTRAAASTDGKSNGVPARNNSNTNPIASMPAPRSAPGINNLKRPTATGSLFGQIVDALGALVPGASITLTNGPGPQKTVTTDREGSYVISNLEPGKYTVRATAPGFAVYENAEVEVISERRQPLNVRLEVTIAKQEVRVTAELPLGSGMNMRVLRGKELDALPNGPGGLSAALRALAVPSTGPNGPQILVDGFSGGQLPPKESIREIRISENPFAAEYPQLGFGRIEIITKPGTDKLKGGLFFGFNDESLNSRNPFAPTQTPFQSRLYGGSLSGPILAKRSSFFAEFERYDVDNNALINATVLDPALNITRLSRAILTPQRRTSFSPRFEFQLNSANTIVARYSYMRASSKKAGVGDFSLASRTYDRSSTEQLLQLTETAVLGPNVINETRFQYLRNRRREAGNNSIATILVPEAFTGGGSQFGRSFNNEDRWDLQNYTSWALSKHNVKFGGQVRGVRLTDSSTQDFGGTFTFSGGFAPQLDASNQVVRDSNGQPVVVPITSIERYRRTLLTPVFQQRGLTLPEIRALGAGATQFSIAAGDPEIRLSQYDLGVFAQDDWQLRPNLTLGLGLRYELQNNINDRSNFAPRLALAWAPGGEPSKRNTVVRAGLGLFYDRFSEAYTLEARRFNGISQQRFIVSDPAILDLFPQVPTVDMLSAFAVPQTITRAARGLRSPYTIQSSIGIERELPHDFTLAGTFINTRTLHMLRSRNINAPLPGTQLSGPGGNGPLFGNDGGIFEYESSGYFKQNQLAVNVVNRLKSVMTLWATYVLNNASSDTDGPETFPASTYDLRSERGRSALDIRHSFYLGGWITGPKGILFSPLLFVRSGAPFNITTGRDTNGDTLFMERPALATDLSRPSVVLTRFGDFDLDPLPGQTMIQRNYGRGPGFFSVNLGVSRAFSFGTEPGAGAASTSSQKDRSRASNRFGWFTTRQYTLTFTIQIENIFNHTNRGLPIGNLSSPLFGQSYSSAGPYGFGSNPVGNRRIEVQVTLSF